jgi:hypothetical protein
MRLSYLRYALKSAPDPAQLLETEAVRLHLNPDLVSLLSQLIPKSAALEEVVNPSA